MLTGDVEDVEATATVVEDEMAVGHVADEVEDACVATPGAVPPEDDTAAEGAGAEPPFALAVCEVQVDTPTDDENRPKKKRRTPGVKVPRWSDDEEKKLRALVTEHGTKDWAKVAGDLGTNRSAAGVDQHWQILSGKRRRNGKSANETGVASPVAVDGDTVDDSPEGAEGSPPPPTPSAEGTVVLALVKPAKRDRRSAGKVARWTPEEEERLRATVDEMKGASWQEIAERLGTNRSGAGVDQHYQIMTGKRKSYYISVAEKRSLSESGSVAPIAVARLESDTTTLNAEIVEAEREAVLGLPVDEAVLGLMPHQAAE